ncbi:YlzJ-like family protein [Pseudogracilibacillus sp. SE30717A]|uniref:YlzJ-like family protein n=1 Tax=Pseudogracilibacillus sp. SE30717A TaxID=3098293 RepID=UPI00300E6286
MIHYTPLEREEIFPSDKENVQIVTYQGKSISVRKNEHGDYQVLQLLSTEPQDFLDDTFIPGSILKRENITEN